MKISAKIDYACKALLELSLHWPKENPLRINEIAQNQSIPMKFLTQILIQLKNLGFVKSVRGKNGGYLLSKSPQSILLTDLLVSFGNGQINSIERDPQKGDDVFESIWSGIDQAVLKSMENITFEIISQRQIQRNNVVTFDI